MIGKIVSHCQIISKLGQGGMAEVYPAQDTRLERDVAVKILPPHLPENEPTLARIERVGPSHPNILTYFDVGQEGPLNSP